MRRRTDAACGSRGRDSRNWRSCPTRTAAAGGALVARALDAMAAMLADAEEELGRIDAIAGDGDHGRGMVKGSSAAREAAAEAVDGRRRDRARC